MPETQDGTIPRFTRRQVRDRYRAQVEAGETRMDFEPWMLDEINALEYHRQVLLEAAQRNVINSQDFANLPLRIARLRLSMIWQRTFAAVSIAKDGG